MFVFVLANAFYLVPVATINAFDRGLKPPPSKTQGPTGQKPAEGKHDDDPPPAWMRDETKALPDAEPHALRRALEALKKKAD